jgi:hypothetical protein
MPADQIACAASLDITGMTGAFSPVFGACAIAVGLGVACESTVHQRNSSI